MEQDKKDASAWHGAKMDFSQSMSYGDYLALDQVLSAQHPRSPNHNVLNVEETCTTTHEECGCGGRR